MRVIYTSKGMSKKFGGPRYTLGARYLSKNTVILGHQHETAQHKISALHDQHVHNI